MKRSVLGGTFDHLHAGHRKLLEYGASLASSLVIGLTLPEMSTKKAWSDQIQPYEERETSIRLFLQGIGYQGELTILPIHDLYGTTLEDTTLETIVVTPQTLEGATRINEEREKRGMIPLQVEVCPLVKDRSGVVLSSSRIREGVVNREGDLFGSLFEKTLVFTNDQKKQLRSPLGEVVGEMSKVPHGTTVICVGDVVTRDAMHSGLPLSSSWVDGHSHHHECQLEISKPYRVVETGLENPAGTIQRDIAIFMGDHLLDEQVLYKIQGEEDLLTLVAIMSAPLGSIILYGNPFPPEGIVIVRVSEDLKERIRSLIA